MLSKDLPRTLILDRDGVINERIPGEYIKSVSEFHFCEGAILALQELRALFDYMFVVTNQQGVGKGLYTMNDLHNIHQYMEEEARVKFDGIYVCPSLSHADNDCRKPKTGMARMALKDCPGVRWDNAIIVGDSISDMEFGENIGCAHRIMIATKTDEYDPEEVGNYCDRSFKSLSQASKYIVSTLQRANEHA